MILHTASEGVSFAKKLESDAAGFYEELARRHAPGAETFLNFAKENRKNITQVERAYYGVITDALEGCFAFNIETDNYTLPTALADGASGAEGNKQAIEIEKTTVAFYTEEQSKSLMADVPRAFMLVARKREKRLAQLEALLGG